MGERQELVGNAQPVDIATGLVGEGHAAKQHRGPGPTGADRSPQCRHCARIPRAARAAARPVERAEKGRGQRNRDGPGEVVVCARREHVQLNGGERHQERADEKHRAHEGEDEPCACLARGGDLRSLCHRVGPLCAEIMPAEARLRTPAPPA